MQRIQLTLSLDEVNTTLEALGQMPFHRVHLLIAKIQQQATAQLQEEQHRANYTSANTASANTAGANTAGANTAGTSTGGVNKE
jgi:hypothetical protein